MGLGELIKSNRKQFAQDPFGYSNSAWQKWAMVQSLAGFYKDPTIAPTAIDLKSPILWMTQAHAMSEAATILVKTEPAFASMPQNIRGICDSQFCAVALMLIGYSLEVSLKAMLIISNGVEDFLRVEKQYKHHRLEELASFVTLSEKEIAILRVLTHFTYWAGRYPDPGLGKVDKAEEIFSLSEMHCISAKDLFETSSKIMTHVNTILDA